MRYADLASLTGFSHRTLQRAVKKLTSTQHVKKLSPSKVRGEVRVVPGKRFASPETGSARSRASGSGARATAQSSTSGAARSSPRKQSRKS